MYFNRPLFLLPAGQPVMCVLKAPGDPAPSQLLITGEHPHFAAAFYLYRFSGRYNKSGGAHYDHVRHFHFEDEAMRALNHAALGAAHHDLLTTDYSQGASAA